MAQVVGHEHDDSFQPMKLPQICLLKLSKDETLTANISEIANNGNLQFLFKVSVLLLHFGNNYLFKVCRREDSCMKFG